jgi:hypothetical protein
MSTLLKRSVIKLRVYQWSPAADAPSSRFSRVFVYSVHSRFSHSKKSWPLFWRSQIAARGFGPLLASVLIKPAAAVTLLYSPRLGFVVLGFSCARRTSSTMAELAALRFACSTVQA